MTVIVGPKRKQWSFRADDMVSEVTMARSLNGFADSVQDRVAELESSGTRETVRVTLTTGATVGYCVAPLPMRVAFRSTPTAVFLVGLEQLTPGFAGLSAAPFALVRITTGGCDLVQVTGLAANTQYRLTLEALYDG